MVTHQLQVRCRPVKVRRSETNVLPLSHPTNYHSVIIPSAICLPTGIGKYLTTLWQSRLMRNHGMPWFVFREHLRGRTLIISVWNLMNTQLKPGFHYPSSWPEFTGRVHGPSSWPEFTARVHGPSSRAEFTARELGCIFWHPSWRVSNAPELTACQFGPWTRVVETGL